MSAKPPCIDDLIGLTLTEIRTGAPTEATSFPETITFITTEGFRFRLYHSQDCCEDVFIAEIIGDLADLLDSPILMAEESTSVDETPEGIELPGLSEGCYTWTFYRFETAKGYVDIRWFGTSNGYYSERVDLILLHPDTEAGSNMRYGDLDAYLARIRHNHIANLN